MKTKKNIDLSPLLLIGMLLAALVMLVGCKHECQELKTPAVVIGASQREGYLSVTVKDAEGKVITYGHFCDITQDLYANYLKGDTIK